MSRYNRINNDNDFDNNRTYNPRTNTYSRVCYYCGEMLPESKTKQDKRNPSFGLLVDRNDVSLEHWKVCEVQQGPEKALENREKHERWLKNQRPEYHEKIASNNSMNIDDNMMKEDPAVQTKLGVSWTEKDNKDPVYDMEKAINTMKNLKEAIDYAFENQDMEFKKLNERFDLLSQNMEKTLMLYARSISGILSELRTLRARTERKEEGQGEV